MGKKKVAIIGAGISGLCAGSYLQMNGYESEIFELHNTPGGLCTAWKRKGYTFDGCLHWLAGSSPADPFYFLWNELIDMESLEFVNPESQFRFISRDGDSLNLYTDVDKLEEELLSIAPEDSGQVKKFTSAIRKLKTFKIPVEKAPEVMSIWDKAKMIWKLLPHLGLITKFGKLSVKEFGEKCRNPLLREVYTHNKLFNRFSMLGLQMSLAWASNKTAGYPIGGSLPFARLFEKSYRDLGGTIHYGSKVSSITVESDKAVGVELENGEKHDADIVISAADGYSTIYQMLDGKYTDKKINDRYQGRDKLLSPFPSLVYVSLGVARKLDHLPHQVMYQLDKPIVIDDKTEFSTLNTTVYHFDPTLAEEGKTCVIVMFESFGYEYWQNLREKDREQYRLEKERICEQIIDILDEKIGDFKEYVEVTDVATPATFIRYTNNWGGSYEGWLPGPGALTYSIKKELPGLSGFYMIGQWVEPGGGLPPAIMSGRNVTQIICKRDGKPFVSKK